MRKSSGLTFTVRVLGIDSPETKKPGVPVECGGPEATAEMIGLTFRQAQDTNADTLADQGVVDQGARVELRTDPTQAVYDRFRRALAYVTVIGGAPAGRTAPYDVGLLMIRSGWATVFVFERDFRRVLSYTDAESDAEAGGAGVYGKCAGDFHSAQP